MWKIDQECLFLKVWKCWKCGSWRFLNIFKGQSNQSWFLSNIIGLKNISSMRFLVLSFDGIYALILYWKSIQKASNSKQISNFKLRVEKHIGYVSLMKIHCKLSEIRAFSLKTISNMPTWWKQISQVFKPLEIDILDQFWVI